MAAEHLHALLVEKDDVYGAMLEQTSSGAPAPLTLERARTIPAAFHELSTVSFDVVILDLGIEGVGEALEFQALERVLEAAGRTPIVALTSRDEDDFGAAIVDAGAWTCLTKSRAHPTLIRRAARYAAVRSRSDETRWLDASMDGVMRLAGRVAHDVNNVLTAIFGYTDLLTEQLPAGSRMRGDVDEIRTSADRAAGLTRQLLQFSQKQAPRQSAIDLNALIAALRPALEESLVPAAGAGAIQLLVTADPALALVHVDRRQFEQVVLALCANAREAMPRGGTLELRTRNVEVRRGERSLRSGLPVGAYVRLTVRDTGVGIPPGDRSRIFEPFFTTKIPAKGAGLGLAVAYAVVKQAGGGIHVEEAPDTQISIDLPAGRREA